MQPTEKGDAESPRGDVIVRLRVDEYDRLAAHQGARTVVAAASLHGMGRTVLFDYRSGRKTPNLTTAMKMADDLGTTVERIFEMRRDGGQAS
jgi:DNA-binding XRE family transcriptional regulator